MALPQGTRIQVMAPVIRGKKGEHAKVFESAKRSGYARARVDGNLYELDEEIKLEKNIKHHIDIITINWCTKSQYFLYSHRPYKSHIRHSHTQSQKHNICTTRGVGNGS
jgi:excinuclease UvrABC ATPase subunit